MTIAIELQGSVVQMVNVVHKPKGNPTPTRRGLIVGFSKASRRRMIEFTARLDLRQRKVVFMTLTFSGSPSPKAAKAALNRFLMRIRRKYPWVSGVWRLEPQERGAPHFHCMLFRFPFVPQRALQRSWEECTGEKMSRLDVRLARGLKSVMAYVSKYIGKASPADANGSLVNASYLNSEGDNWQGRVWGYLNRGALPVAQRYVKVMDNREAERYFWWGTRAHTRGRCGWRKYSAKIYSPDAEHIFAWCLHQGCTDGETWLGSHEHLKRHPDDYWYRMEHFLERSLEKIYSKHETSQ